jgi:hypothetical protein
MGKGGYHGGSTIIGPGSSWFSDTPGGSSRKKDPRKKKVALKSENPVAPPVNATPAPSLSVQVAEARRKIDATKKSLKVCETNVRYAVRARDVVAQRLVDLEAEALRLEALKAKHPSTGPGRHRPRP